VKFDKEKRLLPWVSDKQAEDQLVGGRSAKIYLISKSCMAPARRQGLLELLLFRELGAMSQQVKACQTFSLIENPLALVGVPKVL